MVHLARNAMFILAVVATQAGPTRSASADDRGTHGFNELPLRNDFVELPYAECDDPECGDGVYYDDEWVSYEWWYGLLEACRFRRSSRDGRWSGHGQPLKSTSWLNRPYEFGLDTGAFVMTNSVNSNNDKNNDVLAAAHLGWDWDHYWGTQFRVAWTTPELSSSIASTSRISNDVFLYDLSLMYYPWGDSRVRPYWRFGMGLTDLDFVNPNGVREDDTLFTLPVGLGIKYQTKRWMAFRAEAVDYIAFGQNSANGMNNFTLTFGLEWRFGGRPTRDWSSPSRVRTW